MAGPIVLVSDRAHAALAEYAQLASWRSALVVADANTEEVAGRGVIDELRRAGIRVRELVFEARSGLLAGREQIVRVRAAIDGPAIPIAVGSGVITDIVRYAAHSVDREFVSVATAASMDGYASGVAALEFDGVKMTVPARSPLAVFGDPRVAAQAPAELTRAGAGDLLAKAAARVDWLAAHLLCGEPFVAAAADLMLEPLEFAISQSAQIADAQPEAVAGLLHGLIQSGRAIALAGSSRPASGCEHHASHFWDLLAARGLRQHGSHGLQVAYATRFALRLQRFAYAGPLRSLHPPAPPADPLGASARAWLGDPGSEIIAAVNEKARFIEDAAGSWPSDDRAWERVRDALAGALALGDGVPHALDVLGIPSTPGYLEINERMLRAAFRFASRLRARYTTIDFLEGQGDLMLAIEAAMGGARTALNRPDAGWVGA